MFYFIYSLYLRCTWMGEGWKTQNDQNWPKQRTWHRLGPNRWIFSLSLYFLVLTNVLLHILLAKYDRKRSEAQDTTCLELLANHHHTPSTPTSPTSTLGQTWARNGDSKWGKQGLETLHILSFRCVFPSFLFLFSTNLPFIYIEMDHSSTQLPWWQRPPPPDNHIHPTWQHDKWQGLKTQCVSSTWYVFFKFSLVLIHV